MKKSLKALAAGAMLVASSYAAADVNIGGLTVPTGAVFKVASIYENVVSAVGQELKGVGEVTQINGINISSLCNNCELTYRFGGYTVSSISTTAITFTGGYVNFYLGFGANNDFNPFSSGSSAIDLVAATNGTLFLTLKGHVIDAANNTFAGSGNNIGGAGAAGNGQGLADVDKTGLANGNTVGAGAIANNNFDTNSIAALFGGFADIQLGSDFSSLFVPHPSECVPGQNGLPSGPECLKGSADFLGLVVPEPDSLALMGLGIVALGLGLRRRRAAK